MRLIPIAKGLILSMTFSIAHALEIEERQIYQGTGDEVLRVLSTADLNVFEPFIIDFQAVQPSLTIDYITASSAEVHAAIMEGAAYDVVISSAMDLQFQLANDGFAQQFKSELSEQLPDWAKWRQLVFAFTTEPAVVVISRERFAGLPLPQTRQDMISILRENPERFAASVGTYDIRESGLGYLFATQEARNSDAFWRLSEVMGRLQPRLYCCSGQMINDVASGDLAVAYNVLGSYAAQRLAEDGGEAMLILELEDFGNVMLRTALIPAEATNVAGAGAFVDALIAKGMRARAEDWVLPPLEVGHDENLPAFGPIRLGPALMVYLDPLNRRAFLSSWESAMEQE